MRLPSGDDIPLTYTAFGARNAIKQFAYCLQIIFLIGKGGISVSLFPKMPRAFR